MLILKVGGSAITDKKRFEKADKKAMGNIAIAIASSLAEKMKDGKALGLVLVHGAGSFGHHNVLKYKINDGVKTRAQWVGYRKTRESCRRLSVMFVKSLRGKGVPAVRIDLAGVVEQKNKRIARFDTKLVASLVKEGKVPVLHGDMVLDSTLGASVCSGDQITSYLGKKAQRIVMASRVEGVLDSKGNVIAKITKANKKWALSHVKGADTKDVTGGMRGKLLEIFKSKKPTYVVNATKPDRITAVLLGKKAVCTEIRV